MRTLPLVAGLLSLAAVPAVAEVDHLCSGIGQDRVHEEANFRHTLKLVYAEPGGNYLGYVGTRITAPSGEVMLDVTCDGPWVLANLPAGSYRVEASFGGESKTVTVAVPPGRAREQVITF